MKIWPTYLAAALALASIASSVAISFAPAPAAASFEETAELVCTAAPAAYTNYSGRILSASFSTTDALTSDDIVGDTNVDRITFLMLSTKGGSAQLQMYPTTGSAVDVDAAVTVTANVAKLIILNADSPKARIVFTPSSAAPGDAVWIDAFMGSNGRR